MLVASRKTPGVYREDVFLAPRRPLETGVPVFLGFGAVENGGPAPLKLTLAEQLGARVKPAARSYLAPAVRGFFENGGQECWIMPLEEVEGGAPAALRNGLRAIEPLDEIDLVCAPDVMRPDEDGGPPSETDVAEMQTELVSHCDRAGDRFAILDARPEQAVSGVIAQRGEVEGTNAALYYPWIAPSGDPSFVPPSGHVAGAYARTDRRHGVHKAPANVVLEGVLDLEVDLDKAQQDALNPAGVNCLRSFPARGIRVWGARTLAAAPWHAVNVRRLFLTTVRWIERNVVEPVFEPSTPALWARIQRDVSTYLNDQYRAGALAGATPEEAFYVRCDATTNPPSVREAGTVVAEIGLAPSVPSEFLVVRIAHSAGEVSMAGVPG